MFPTCPEVCEDCQDGKHVMHVITELADFRVTKDTYGPVHGNDWKETTRLHISGQAEGEDFLLDLLRVLHREYECMKPGCEACRIESEIGTREVPHPIDRRIHTCSIDRNKAYNPKTHEPGSFGCSCGCRDLRGDPDWDSSMPACSCEGSCDCHLDGERNK